MKSLFLIVPLVALGQIGPPPVVPILPSANLEWDAVALDVNGDPDVISHYTVAVTPVTATIPAQGVTLKSQDVSAVSGTTLGLDAFLVGLPAAEYKLWVRAVDTSANESGWSLPLVSRWDRAAPQVPANLLISVP